MCLGCVPKWCQQQMNAHKFKNFENMGFSVGCPGPGIEGSGLNGVWPFVYKVCPLLFCKPSMDQSRPDGSPVGDQSCPHRIVGYKVEITKGE